MAFGALSVTTGCQTSNAFKVPGESSIITKNIASEYFTIAEGYADLKKYDKAAEYYKYAMNDADIVVSFCAELFQCNHAVPMTLSSAAASAMYASIKAYFGVKKKSRLRQNLQGVRDVR